MSLIYDLMSFTEKQKKIQVLLMLTDFENNFHFISWKFLYNILDLFVLFWQRFYSLDQHLKL